MTRLYDIRPLPKMNDRARIVVSPVIVYHEITRRCQLACGEKAEEHSAELSPVETRRLIEQVGEFPEPPALVLSGGDPLERPDLFSIVEHARRNRLKVAVVLAATRLATRKALWRLREVGVSRLAIRLDGAEAEVHDGLVGVPGSCRRTWEIIETARALGIPFQINTTLQPANLSHIHTLADQIAMASAKTWSVSFLVPTGEAHGQARLTADQCEIAFARLWLQSRLQSYEIETVEAPHYGRYVLEYLRQHGIGDPLTRNLRRRALGGSHTALNSGKGTMFINHAGLIYPGQHLPLVCGAFPISHPVEVYQNAPIFRSLRNAERLEGKCSFCEYRHVCGGCRARAFAVTSNLFAQEPDCSYVPFSMQEYAST